MASNASNRRCPPRTPRRWDPRLIEALKVVGGHPFELGSPADHDILALTDRSSLLAPAADRERSANGRRVTWPITERSS
jgi:hypothetical protein